METEVQVETSCRGLGVVTQDGRPTGLTEADMMTVQQNAAVVWVLSPDPPFFPHEWGARGLTELDQGFLG
jgi:hypothetical protein